MAGYSVWSAQALQHFDNSDGPLKVKYFQSSREVLKEVQDNPVVFRNFGHPQYYADDSNASLSSFSWTAFKPYPSPEGKKENESKAHSGPEEKKKDRSSSKAKKEPTEERADRKKEIPNLKPNKDAIGLPKIFDDPMEQPQDHHEGLQRRIVRIEDFLLKVFPSWYDGNFNLEKFVKKFQERISKFPNMTGNRTLENPDLDSIGMAYKYALVFGETTEFNPSGIWVVEEFFNNDDI